ncbi:MAG: glycosyltransferase [Planctomycetota bacterium]
MARISLCMIAKNEERFLGGALESVRDAVDEMIVVDTGSNDRTVAIAEEHGARVLHTPWHDDFAAARNVGLAAASGTHVLALDADERLAPSAARALASAAADTSIWIGMLPLHDADALDARAEDVIAGRARIGEPVWLPRFFRRDERLRFRRRVHETIVRDLASWFGRQGERIAAVEAPIVHFGEVKVLRAELGRSARNRRLLERALAEDPADGDLAGYLALELVRAGDRARAHTVARASFEPFLAALDRAESQTLRPSPIQLASVLATLTLEDGDARRALDVVRSAQQRCAEPHPNLRFLEGAALEALDELTEAERCYRDCIAMHGRRQTIPVNPGATSAAPRLRLANVLVRSDHPRDALALLEGLAGKYHVPAALMRAEALLALGDPARALSVLAPLMGTTAPPPDLFALAAWASTLLGQREDSLAHAAKSAAPERWVEPRRRIHATRA